MNRFLTSLGGFTLATLTAAIALVACSSSGTASSTGATDTEFCSDYTAFVNRCPDQAGGSVACQQAVVAEMKECTQFASVFSDAFKQVFTECESGMVCNNPFNDPFLTTCFESKLPSTPLTPIQQKLANDYCASCAAPTGLTMATCVSTFWGLDADAGLPSPGGPALTYSDAIVQKVAATCLPALHAGSAQCSTSFNLCVNTTVISAAEAVVPTPAACANPPPPSADGGS